MSAHEDTLPDRVALIVCSDDRAETLALRLADYFKVFRVAKSGTFEWQMGAWVVIVGDKVPKALSCIFFHTGNNDENLITPDFAAIYEFAFSGGGEPQSRRKAYKILSPFEGETCPVTKHIVDQIIDLLEGRRQAPPSVCVRRLANSPLAALILLCQGYLIVNADRRGELEAQEQRVVVECLTMMGWRDLQDGDSIEDFLSGHDLPLRLNLDALKKQVRSTSWWLNPFSAWLSEKESHVGAALLVELETEWSIAGGGTNEFIKIRELLETVTGPDLKNTHNPSGNAREAETSVDELTLLKKSAAAYAVTTPLLLLGGT